MPRLPVKPPEELGLMPWDDIAKLMGLPKKRIRQIYDDALIKLQDEMKARELTFDVLATYYHQREQDNESR